MLAHGPEHANDCDLLAILLRTGSGDATAVDLANQLVSKYDGLSGLATRSHGDLLKFKGIGEAKAVTLLAAFEIGRRLAAGGTLNGRKISNAADVADYFRHRLRDLKREVFIAVLLDTQNRVIRDVKISEGSLNASVVHPREVFKEAVAESAAAVILVHNHPSGETDPSTADLDVTRQLVEAGRLLDIPVHDHVIVSAGGFTSLLDAGLL